MKTAVNKLKSFQDCLNSVRSITIRLVLYISPEILLTTLLTPTALKLGNSHITTSHVLSYFLYMWPSLEVWDSER